MRTSRAAGVAASAAAYVAALAVAVLVVGVSGLAAPLAQTRSGHAGRDRGDLRRLRGSRQLQHVRPVLEPAAARHRRLLRVGELGELSGRQILVTVLVLLYALRLTSNFYRDWPGLAKEDFRYVDFRRRFGRLYWPVSFLGIHLFPTVMVFLGCLPMYAISRPGVDGLRWLDAVAALVTLGAIGLAFVADEQLRGFRRDPANRGRCIRTGLWARSRHPNYLGEIATWWGFWLFALAAGPVWWWTGAGAAAITLMFVFVSVPMMEKRALATRTGYGEYRARTPMLLPGLRQRPAAAEGDGGR